MPVARATTASLQEPDEGWEGQPGRARVVVTREARVSGRRYMVV